MAKNLLLYIISCRAFAYKKCTVGKKRGNNKKKGNERETTPYCEKEV